MDDRAPTPAPGDGAAPVRSAASVADEAAADEARRRFHERGIVPITPDARIGVLLRADELVVAVRRAASLDRRQRCRDDARGLRGDLYVTTRRLVHLGRTPVVYALEEIREAVVAADQLHLVVGENRGVTIDVGDPRLLRVEIAAARAAARKDERGTPDPASIADPDGVDDGQPSSR